MSAWTTVAGRGCYDSRDSLKKLTIIRSIPPAPSIAAPSEKRKPGRQASDRRRARDRRRREAWAKRRLYRSQPSLHTTSRAEDDSATAEPATARQANTPTASLPPPTVLTESPQPVALSSPSPSHHIHRRRRSPSRHSRPRHRRRYHRSRHRHRKSGVKTASEATRASSRATVLAKKRPIPQLDRCCSPPTSSSQPTPSPAAPPLAAEPLSLPLELPDGTPIKLPEISPALLAHEAPTPLQALPLWRAPSPPDTDPVLSRPVTPADNPVPPAEPFRSTPGYTLVMIWCPSCNNNLIDNRDIECYMCQDQRYHRSFYYEDK
jgi:hypothetical protein